LRVTHSIEDFPYICMVYVSSSRSEGSADRYVE
jgi:hypothetical protein